MSQYTSYWLYQKYEKRGDQDWLPCYPNVLSVDADGTRQRVVKEENDTGCGYTPEPDAEYRWIQVPISEDYICDYCPIYRWHEAPVTDYYCSGTTKWTKEYFQVSLDNGVTWNNVVPEQTRKGNTIIEEESMDCGYVPPVLYEWRRITPVAGDDSTFVCDTCCVSQYRWVDLDPTVNYFCSGTTKYYKQQKQVSIDCGEHWNWVSPAEYQWGASAQAWSTDCGYVPMERTTSGTPYCSGETGYDKYVDVYSQISYDGGSTWQTTATTPTLIKSDSEDCGFVFNGKFRAKYSDRAPYSAACDGDTTLTSATTKPGMSYSTMTDALIGDCVTNIYAYPQEHKPTYSSFSDCTGLTSVTIGNNVENIGFCAFEHCTSLPSVTIPNSVTIIGEYAFSWCYSLTGITVPDSVEYINYAGFYYCTSLREVTIGTGIKMLGGGFFGAFEGCAALTSVTINATTPPALAGDAFAGTPIEAGTGYIYVPCSFVDVYKSANGWNKLASQIKAIEPCGEQYRTLYTGETCVNYDKYVLEEYQVSYDYGTTWTTTGTSATTLIETNSVDCGYVPSIKFRAIYNDSTSSSAACNGSTELTSKDVRPRENTYSKMVSAYIGDCITSIGSSAFSPEPNYGTRLSSVVIPSSVTSIGSNAFERCNHLTNIVIPNSVTSIGASAFQSCSSLTNITIPSGVTSIGNQTFYECGLTSCTIGSGVTSIGTYAFRDCSHLPSINIPDAVTSIGYAAFYACIAMTTCTIGSGVTYIGSYAFYGCSGLTSITIPDSVTNIDTYAFHSCSRLTSVTIQATTPPTLGNNVFYNTNNCPIYVPSGSVNSYKAASGWSTYADRIQPIT